MREKFCNGKRRVLAAVFMLMMIPAVFQGVRASSLEDDRGFFFGELRVIGLTDDGRLVSFKTRSPKRTRDIGYVTGLSGSDTALVGIDFRVQDGRLYGVGNGGGVYTIDTGTAQATFVNALSVPLSGTFFGVDFNPAADRLRIVSDNGQNLAHNVNAGGVTAVNGVLTSTVPPATPVPAAGIVAAAYTNSDLNQPATATMLFDLDTMQDQVVIQSPPGAGILAATGMLGVEAGADAGFDIYSQLSSGVTIANVPFATLKTNGKYHFYFINVTTGDATSLGAFDDNVIDIALPLRQ
jgi:hypothetical protein